MASPLPLIPTRSTVLRAAWLAVLIGAGSVVAHAQSFPPAALETATTVDAAYVALGAGKPPASTRLLLDLPDVAVPGRIRARLGSELPGTAAFVLLRGEAGIAPAPSAAPVSASSKPSPVLIKAHKFPPGEPATLVFDFDLEGQTQSYTLLAYVQGRWLSTTRQVKVGAAQRAAATPKKR